MKQFFLAALTMFAAQSALAQILLGDALAAKKVVAEKIASTGGTNLEICLHNPTKRPLSVQIVPGTLFAASDSGYQDVLLMKSQMIVLEPDARRTIKAEGFCTESHNASPSSGAAYTYQGQANGKLKDVISFLMVQKDAAMPVQEMVWAATDKTPSLSGMYHPNPKKNEALLDFMSKLTNVPRPTQVREYSADPRDPASAGQVAYRGELRAVHGNFEYSLTEPANISLAIYNESGELVQEFFKDQRHEKGIWKYRFAFRATDLPRGKYTSKLFKNGEVFKTMEVNV